MGTVLSPTEEVAGLLSPESDSAPSSAELGTPAAAGDLDAAVASLLQRAADGDVVACDDGASPTRSAELAAAAGTPEPVPAFYEQFSAALALPAGDAAAAARRAAAISEVAQGCVDRCCSLSCSSRRCRRRSFLAAHAHAAADALAGFVAGQSGSEQRVPGATITVVVDTADAEGKPVIGSHDLAAKVAGEHDGCCCSPLAAVTLLNR